jgi:hypothetical protein
VGHVASVINTVTHGNLSSCAFYSSCLLGLVYSNLKLRVCMNLTNYKYIIIHFRCLQFSYHHWPQQINVFYESSLTFITTDLKNRNSQL